VSTARDTRPPARSTATVAAVARRVDTGEVVGLGLVLFSLIDVVLAALLAFAPHAFFEDVGPYGVRNAHYMRDLATFYAALGAIGLIAYRRVSWRTPVLCCLAIEYALHTINHLVDVGNAQPHWLGPVNFASLAIATGVLVWLARESAQPPEVQR
jgi:hypothetical protein